MLFRSLNIFGYEGKYEKAAVSLPLKYINREARLLFYPVSELSQLIAVITIVPTLTDFDVSNHDFAAMKLMARVKTPTDCSNELIRSLHTELANFGSSTST